ncbi:MAG TPA: aconitate hydratase AcnA [Stellaceae bacterium]|nr:aconitate hydratase AcnA [Stellaceae bacterium]
MKATGRDSLKTRRALAVGGAHYDYFSLAAAGAAGLGDIGRLPYALKILLENLLRLEDGRTVTTDDARALADWLAARRSNREIAFRPARVLMQDFTGVPAIVDLAAMREAMARLGGDPNRINPLSPVDLVIDHSVMVDSFARPDSFAENVRQEFARNGERYSFLRWGQDAFDNFRVVPPGTGICHQVNLEYLARVVWTGEEDGRRIACPDTLVGTDSHTTMINGLSVLGWGVGGIEAEAAMLGQPISMLLPEVVGFRLDGRLREGATATDLVLTITEMLRRRGVVGRFVEFFGPGVGELALPDRATIANMAPEYGATCGFFPIDDETIRYLAFTGRDAAQVALVEAYAKAQGLWRDETVPEPLYSDTLELDLGRVESSLAGPRRPQDRIALAAAKSAFARDLPGLAAGRKKPAAMPVAGAEYRLRDGDIVIAAITSCTNTSNPSVMLMAGLLARKAVARGLKPKPWVKTSLAPGSQVVSDYYEAAGVQEALDALGFNLVGYGCTTCIGNSGPVPEPIADAVAAGDLAVCAVLSGNRNFEGRINPVVRANYLMAPPLVVAYALAGSLSVDLIRDPLGEDRDGKPVYLRDIWPSGEEVQKAIEQAVSPQMFRRRYADVFKGPEEWRRIAPAGGRTFAWSEGSTYIRHPPYFDDMTPEPAPLCDIAGARLLALLGDSITTDHISPAGTIARDSPAGHYLIGYQVRPGEFNSYGSRRGNHEVMMRGTFANIRIRNELVPGVEGGMTRLLPEGQIMPIYDAAIEYARRQVPLLVIAGKEYGTGSSRDWAAKGTRLLGVRAVLAESFERIHRSNLIGMGVLPLEFPAGTSRQSLKIAGDESFDISGIADGLRPRAELRLCIHRANGAVAETPLCCRIDTLDELEYYRHGGILHYVLRSLLQEGARSG